jgi:hypothetical protein
MTPYPPLSGYDLIQFTALERCRCHIHLEGDVLLSSEGRVTSIFQWISFGSVIEVGLLSIIHTNGSVVPRLVGEAASC